MLAVESSIVSFLTVGEGWHNYHHAFPWDYRAAEYGTSFSFTTFMIDFLAYIGLAYDLKTTPDDMVLRRALRSGDGSHKFSLVEEPREDDEANVISEKVQSLITDMNNNEVVEECKSISGDANLDKLIKNSGVTNFNLNGKIFSKIE